MSDVRVRFAPSPTGFFHIGSARTALFNWLYARHTGGTFILRIEDTDQARNTPEALQVLFDGMKWLGLGWDEGPEVDGPAGPYFQSQRAGIYREHLERLKAAGYTYEQDGAVWFRLEGERYTEFDAHLDREVEKVKAAPVVIDDQVRGRVERHEEKDFVLVRSSGEPVFHLTNVVDDITMGVTHVIRGEDHLSNTSKHVLLYQALDAPVPTFAHIPLILKESGGGKMSKRDKGALIEEYQQRGYLPEAVRNFLALLGWSPKDDREVMTIDEIIERFDFPGIQRGNARFDEQKLNHLNTEHLRALPLETFAWMAAPVLSGAGVIDDQTDEDYLQRVLSVAQPKASHLEGLPALVGNFFDEAFPYDEKALKKPLKKGAEDRVAEILPVLEQIGDWSTGSIDVAINVFAESKNEKPFAWYPALRLATTGQGGGPELLPLLEALGKERVLTRLRRAQTAWPDLA